MKFRMRLLALLTVMLLFTNVHDSYAWLTRASNPVENSFTIGDIQLTLTETTGSTYRMIPGVTIRKDPTVTVKANSKACWLFVQLETTKDFDRYFTYFISGEWTALSGYDGVWYRQVDATAQDVSFGVLEMDQVTVNETVTEEQLAALPTHPGMRFLAYAVQQLGLSTAEDAWEQIVLSQE